MQQGSSQPPSQIMQQEKQITSSSISIQTFQEDIDQGKETLGKMIEACETLKTQAKNGVSCGKESAAFFQETVVLIEQIQKLHSRYMEKLEENNKKISPTIPDADNLEAMKNCYESIQQSELFISNTTFGYGKRLETYHHSLKMEIQRLRQSVQLEIAQANFAYAASEATKLIDQVKRIQ